MAGHSASEWAGPVGERWHDNIDRFESMLTEIGTAAVAHAGFAPGERVVDVGCGGGPTTLAIASIVGPAGRVTGADISPMLVDLANGRAASSGIGNASFEVVDGEFGTPSGVPFDRLFSRFGVMFFENSTRAFANMRGWLKPGGRIDFAAWGAPEENPWFGAVGGIMARLFDLPPPDPDAPGPFRFGDAAATKAMLEAAGYTGVTVSEHRADQPFAGEGASVDDAVGFVVRALDMQALLDEVNADKQAEVLAEVREVFARHAGPAGILMPGMTLFFTATAA